MTNEATAEVPASSVVEPVSGDDQSVEEFSHNLNTADKAKNVATVANPISCEDPARGAEAGLALSGDGNEQPSDQRKPRPPRPPGSIKQARRERRKAGWERRKAQEKQSKMKERERREEAMRQAGVEIPQEGKLWRELPPEQWSISQKIRMAKRKDAEELARSSGYHICVDMAFDDLMQEKARASLVQQILYLYGTNRKAEVPCLVTLSGMGPLISSAIKRLSGFDAWIAVTKETRCYTELFEKGDLVYLSADSPNTITQLEKGKVYIIGGLVDRNAHKALCLRKATEQGIATAKLPLNREDLRDAHAKVLATNHVFEILSRAMASGGDLEKVERKSLPPRKRAGWTGGDDRPQKKTPSDESTLCEDGCRESDTEPPENEPCETCGDEKEP